MANAVTAITGTLFVPSSARIARVVSQPSTPDIMMSINTTSTPTRPS